MVKNKTELTCWKCKQEMTNPKNTETTHFCEHCGTEYILHVWSIPQYTAAKVPDICWVPRGRNEIEETP